MKNLILILLPLSISFDYSPQTKGSPDDIIGCVKACARIGSATRCSADKSYGSNKSENNKKTTHVLFRSIILFIFIVMIFIVMMIMYKIIQAKKNHKSLWIEIIKGSLIGLLLGVFVVVFLRTFSVL